MKHEIVKLLGNTEKSYYRWKKEGRPIIALLEKYFTKEDLQEFLSTQKILKLELQKNLTTSLVNKIYKTYFIDLIASSNILGSTLGRAYFWSFILHIKKLLDTKPWLPLRAIDLQHYLDSFESSMREGEINAYTQELCIEEDEYTTLLTNSSITGICKDVVYDLLINFSQSEMDYLMVSLKKDFIDFYNELRNKLDRQSVANSLSNHWIRNLADKYENINQKDPEIGLFDVEIFYAEYTCAQNKKSLKETRDKIDNLLVKFYKAQSKTTKKSISEYRLKIINMCTDPN